MAIFDYVVFIYILHCQTKWQLAIYTMNSYMADLWQVGFCKERYHFQQELMVSKMVVKSFKIAVLFLLLKDYSQ